MIEDPCVAFTSEGIEYREFSCLYPVLEPFYFRYVRLIPLSFQWNSLWSTVSAVAVANANCHCRRRNGGLKSLGIQHLEPERPMALKFSKNQWTFDQPRCTDQDTVYWILIISLSLTHTPSFSIIQLWKVLWSRSWHGLDPAASACTDRCLLHVYRYDCRWTSIFCQKGTLPVAVHLGGMEYGPFGIFVYRHGASAAAVGA